jgi:hypothetical protein
VTPKLVRALLLVAAAGTASAQTYPATFHWRTLPGQDQQIQGPCHIFAATALVENVHGILYGWTPNLSETHLWSPCASANLLSTTTPDALAFMMNKGVVNEDCLPYTSPSLCNTTPPPTASCNASTDGYFADQINTLQLSDCGTPWCRCSPGSLLPGERYRVAAYAELPIRTFAGTNDLKRALLNKGPIALWMRHGSLHVCEGSAANHGYLLYGWTTSSSGAPVWYLKDSWPGWEDITSTTLDIVALFQQNTQFTAWVVGPANGKPAVYVQDRVQGVWTDRPQTLTCLSGSTAFSISGPSLVTETPAAFSLTNAGLLDSPAIEWSTEATPGYPLGSVSLSPATGASTSVTRVADGYVTLVARVKRANGLCEKVVKATLEVKSNACTIPTFPQFPIAPSSVYTCPGNFFQLTTTAGFLEYRWQPSFGLTIDGYSGGSLATSNRVWVRVGSGFSGGGVVRLWVRNACGWSTDDNRTYVHRSYSSCP